MPTDARVGTDPTLLQGPATERTDQAPAYAPPSHTSVPGYELGAVIGAGGMGEVVLARDAEIGRDVAVKRIRGDADTAATERFLREARIQARLEHPAIVPVYEIGRDESGAPYFAMKRLAGRTLADIAREHPPRQRLLRMFLDICRAVEFAHARGVVHRDLKPANVAAGEHGDIYVLDWGLARIVDEEEAVSSGVYRSLEGMTQADTILGTPGYMAPEQVRDPRAVGPAADVYSLGAILFELLAGEPVLAPTMAALQKTVEGVDGSPTKRRRELEIPPELDAACVAALARAPEARPTARELAERVQRYLDGDRDVEGRRALAAEHLATARAVLDDGDIARRADAAHAAGRALALDPESRDAAALVNRLLFELPRELPTELVDALAASEIAAQRRQSKLAVASYCTILAFLVIASWNGVTSWRWWGACVALTSVLGVASWRFSRRRPHRREMFAMVVGNAVLAAMGSRAYGSFVMLPTVTCIMTLSFTSYPQLLDRPRRVIAILAAGWLLPIVLEAVGVLPAMWSVGPTGINSSSAMLVLGGANTVGLLIGLHVAMIVTTGLFANALAVSRHKALRDTEIREWHLRQLLSVR